MKEKLFLLGLLAGVAYGLYRFATWEPETPVEDVIRNLCLPTFATLLAVRIVLGWTHPQK